MRKKREPDKEWISNRFREFFESTEMTVSRFAEALGEEIRRNRMYKVISGENNVSLEVISKAKWAFPDLNLHWLIFGVGEMMEPDLDAMAKDFKNDVRKLEKEIKALKALNANQKELIDTQRIAIEALKELSNK